MRIKRFMTYFMVFLVVVGGVLLRFDVSAQTTPTTQMPTTIRVGLTRWFANQNTLTINNSRLHVGYNENGTFVAVQTVDSASGFIARVNAAGQVVLYAGNQAVFTFARAGAEPQVRCAIGGMVVLHQATWGNVYYRGVIALRVANRQITAINVICPEEYLMGVLPQEMSPSWHTQALMAQSIASRTFIMHRIASNRHAGQGFYLCDSTCCQVYRGAESEHANTTSAILATRGLMMFYNDRPIMAVYGSSSGGATDNSENVWFEARPYLRSVNSISEFNATSLQWTRTFTWAEITALLNSANANIGTATGMAIAEVGTSGRVQEIIIFGTNGQHRLMREGIQSFFGPSAGGALRSRNFHVVEALPVLPAVWVYDGRQLVEAPLSMFHGLDRNGISTPMHRAFVYDGTATRSITPAVTTFTGGTGVTFVGSGWGHGLGMSQHGAQGMALLGFTYRQILLHYYTGVEIR
ncbi:MAG: SpoIID/LytB domain-containing protein [Defluviitaleaceae bacterium]|nr:SpoIID/LytB domain-containing protein [Defluviitaleaceae bacterium]